MGLLHNLKKVSIYFSNNNPYWTLIDLDKKYTVDSKLIPFCGLNLKARLEDNHYDLFDDDGFPIRMVEGKVHYNYTTICSYAMAKWQVYLETGDVSYTEQIFKTIEFLKKNHIVTNYGGWVYPFKGSLSAMNQGEVLSVIARAYELKPNQELVEMAKNTMKAYSMSIDMDGVKGVFTSIGNADWYEEHAKYPLNHILNGMCYSVAGLYDIKSVMPELQEADDLFNRGINSIEKALPQFDKGDWSWYWYAENGQHYIASMMYHNLHVCQLNYLGKVANNTVLLEYANRFDHYQNNAFNRLKGAFNLAYGKWKKR